ncbi:MAG: SCO6745 family protein [Acidimicrobiia bacterium]
MTDLDPTVARRTWRTVEPIHGMIYFSPEAAAAYEQLGLTGRMGYFASRAAPIGAVSAELVIATFFNFRPALVRASIPEAWDHASPAEILAARVASADAALRRSIPDAIGSADMRQAADLARRAALRACDHLEGRPLFAGHAALPWPDESHLVLWHAQSLLREFRGDGHIAALLAAGLSGLEAAITHVATGDVPGAVMTATRAWPDDEWNAAIDDLRSRGLVEPGDLVLTDAGRAQRQWIEDTTDRAAVVAYEPLGDDGCARLRTLVRPWSRAIVDGGLLG